MDARYGKTRYRVAQHWRFRNDTPEASDVLVIIGVEDHPTEGIICEVQCEFDPPFWMTPNSTTSPGSRWLTKDALDRSVTELVTEKGPLPAHRGSTGEFSHGPEIWEHLPGPWASNQTVGALLREQTERLRRERDELADRPAEVEPPVESLGLWSLIAGDHAERFAELLEQHPAMANEPLPRDDSDGYCYTGEEYEDCYPLMLAAELGSVPVAEVLLRCGADPRQVTSCGDTALHYAARSPHASDGTADVARMLCERGADPEAMNAAGLTPIKCGHSDVAAVLIAFGASPTLCHAIRLRMIAWARRELRDNPEAVRATGSASFVMEDIGYLIQSEAERGHGRALRLERGETPGAEEDDWADRMEVYSAVGFTITDDEAYIDGLLARWKRQAEFERAAFAEYRDLLEIALERGAVPTHGCLHSAAQMLDTSLAEWLLTHGVDPNAEVRKGSPSYFLDLARTRRMAELLKKYGAMENPYSKAMDRWDREQKEFLSRLKERFV